MKNIFLAIFVILVGCQSPMLFRLSARYATITSAATHCGSASWPYIYTVWSFSNIKGYKNYDKIDTIYNKIQISKIKKNIRKSCYLKLPHDWYQQLYDSRDSGSVAARGLRIAEAEAQDWMLPMPLYSDSLYSLLGTLDIRSHLVNPSKKNYNTPFFKK